MANKFPIKCSSCFVDFYKWPYEIKNIKNIKTYVCKTCKAKNCREKKICPICNLNFTSPKRENKITCSYSCANKFFRTGENNGNWKIDTYRSTCFLYHKKECIVCKESKLVEVHHYDNDHSNNKIENLIPLCPTHHKYMHSRYSVEISSIVDEYHKNFRHCSIG